jgi:hypothetical protein
MTRRISIASALLALCWVTFVAGQETAPDPYGGVAIKVAEPGDSYSVKKVGNRWTFVTPAGNAFFMLGVMDVDTMSSKMDDGRSYEDILSAKYGTRPRWARKQLLRLQQWGFNTLAEYASYYALAYPNAASPAADVKLPSIKLFKFSFYSYTNRSLYAGQELAPDAVKDVVDCQCPTYTGYRGTDFPDVFDPNFDTYINGMLKAISKNPGESGHLKSRWAIGLTADDSDDMFGFGPGPEIPGLDGAIHPHLAWLALACNPRMPASRKWGRPYADPVVHIKAELISDLKAKYGNIQALNAAWNSNYSSFGSSGGWGPGKGLEDEDGRHTTWLGSTDGDLRGARPAVVRDLDDYLLKLARRYYKVTSERMRQYAPGKLIFSNITLNGHQGLSRKQVLQAAGEYVDVINASIRDQKILDKTAEYAGDKPIVSYDSFVANPDSGLANFENPKNGGFNLYNTQRERAEGYAQKLAFLRDARVTRTGEYPVVGIKLWQYVDNWGEKTAFGLVSGRDNPYDGIATSAPYAEVRQYGDFVGAATNANRATLLRFNAALSEVAKNKP